VLSAGRRFPFPGYRSGQDSGIVIDRLDTWFQFVGDRALLRSRVTSRRWVERLAWDAARCRCIGYRIVDTGCGGGVDGAAIVTGTFEVTCQTIERRVT